MLHPIQTVLRASHGAHFASYCQGVSHAEWPKDNDEYAPTKTDEVAFYPRKAVGIDWDIECYPPRIEGPSKRAKKL